MMTCFFCKGDMAPDFTTYMEEHGEGVLVVKHVPCRKCTQCGEVSYASATVRHLEEMLAAMQGVMPEVAVLNYTPQAA